MAFEERDNSGTIFKNDYKKTDAQPTYTGKGMIGGVEGRFSLWVKQGAKGPFMSLAWTPNEEMGERASAPKATSSQSKPMTKAPAKREVIPDEEDDDFIPF
jgi:phage repressor protein C with HTH and peptisase S24 domain